MADKSTFIKIDRNIQDWRWYTDGNTFRVFIHLLLNANIKKHGFKGYDILRGQIATSYKSIAKSLSITEMQSRTAINHLKLTGEVTSQLCHDFSLITIVKYDLYQDYITPQVTGYQQADNKAITSQQQADNNDIRKKECKNGKNGRSSKPQPPTLTDISSYIETNNLNVDGEKFFKSYSKRDWKTTKGNSIVDCWQEKLKEWSKTEFEKPSKEKADYAAYDIDLFEKMLNEK